jgi:hypothetical protein
VDIRVSIAQKIDTTSIQQQLAEHEAEMRRCWQQFAKRLAIIRDERLYRAEFETFEAYCADRWGIRRDIANKRIVASSIADDLNTIVFIPNEGTAREFVAVPKEDRPKVAEVAKEVAKEKGRDTINSRDVREAKAKVYKVETKIEELPRTEEAEPLPTEPDPVTLADDTDGDWLESLPLSSQLQGLPLRKFEEAARLWQQFEAPFKVLAQQIRHEQKTVKTQFHSRFFVQQRASFVIDEPQHWLICRECAGTGQIQQVGHCSSCNGDGFYASQYNGR